MLSVFGAIVVVLIIQMIILISLCQVIINDDEVGKISLEIIDEIHQSDIQETERSTSTDVEIDFFNDDIPEYLSYGHYTKKEISETELQERIDPRIRSNCNFCEFPLYELNFHHGNGIYTYSDAFTVDYGDKIVLLVNLPTKGNRKGTRKKSEYGKSILEVHPISSSSLISIELKNTNTYYSLFYFVMTFSLENHKELLDTCFHILLKNDRGEYYLTKPIFVRHCHSKNRDQEKKRDKVALCGMMYNPDRWMIEWIEWHRMMGVSHFYLYMHQHTTLKHTEGYYDTTFSLLDYYVKERIVSLFLWNYTRDEEYWGLDQNAAYNDCIWRFRDHTEYLLLIDIDEFIVPIRNNDIISVLEGNEKELRGSGYLLDSYDFDQDRTTTSHLSTISYRKVDSLLEKWKKMLIKPDRVAITDHHNVKRRFRLYGLPVVSDEMLLAHYTERKFHEYNRIIKNLEEFEKENKDSEYLWVLERVQDFTKELEKRVNEMEEKLDVAQYQYQYHSFNPGNLEDYTVLPTHRYQGRKRLFAQKKIQKKIG